ncbi:hypothetical protein PENSPDRAFT_662529 [Peniophora sp. CONT]|nr:hypothetical protein PENSPDRAFT_662529 [Peniophora sp. CONT]
MSDSDISLFSHSSASTPAEDELDLVHDEQFYFRIVVFRAGKTLFKVPTYSFPADEGLFASMFLLPKGDGEPEGSSDKNPIRLPPEVSAADFKSLLKACLPQSVARAPPKLSVDEWMSVLNLSTMWCLDDLRSKSVNEADAGVAELGAIEKLVLAKRYSVSRWFIEAVEALARRDAYLSAEERDKVGVQTSFALMELRERSWSWADSQNIDGAHQPGQRLNFDFQSAIHEIFREDLVLDKDYAAPTPPVEDPEGESQSS